MKETISVCIIAYNEEKYLPNLFNDIIRQDYTHSMIEVVLVNCMSTDCTEEIMYSFMRGNKDFHSVKVLNNSKKIQAAGWNIALKAALGDVVVRIDAHAKLPPNFVTNVMKTIHSGELVVGGVRPCIIESKTNWARVLLETENSLFGSSPNKVRRSFRKAYVKTMFHPAYSREVITKVGLFNENLFRTEDNEYHYRIRQAGFKLCYNPEIISYQYSRPSLRKMVIQKFQNGLWIGKTIKICHKCISLYHLVPLGFVIAIVISSSLLFVGLWKFSVSLWIAYFIFCFLGFILSVINDGFCIHKLLMPFLFLILHISYGLGSFIGLFLEYNDLKSKSHCK